MLKINPLIIQDLKNDYEDEDGECTCGAVNSDKSLVNVAEPRLIAAELLVNVALPRLIAIGDCWLMLRGSG